MAQEALEEKGKSPCVECHSIVVMVSSSSVGNLAVEILYGFLHGSEAWLAREGLIALSGLFAEIIVWEEMVWEEKEKDLWIFIYKSCHDFVVLS